MKEFFVRLKFRIIWSWNGCVDAWKNEHSFRSWIWAYGVTLIVAFALPLTWGERALVLSLGLLVIAAELMNTAIETVVDYISLEQHPLAGRAKDAGSAGVFVTSIATGVAWCFVLWRVFTG